MSRISTSKNEAKGLRQDLKKSIYTWKEWRSGAMAKSHYREHERDRRYVFIDVVRKQCSNEIVKNFQYQWTQSRMELFLFSLSFN